SAGWTEMCRHPRQLEIPFIVVGNLTGEAVQQVPIDEDAFLHTPLERLEVYQRIAALAHQVERVSAQVLDARLHGEVRIGQGLDLRLLEIRFYLADEVSLDPLTRDLRQQFLEVVGAENVVDEAHDSSVVTAEQVRDFADRPRCLLHTELHRKT